MTSIYIPPIVQQIRAYYGPILTHYEKNQNLENHLILIAERMWIGLNKELDLVITQINNYHQSFLSKSKPEILAANLTKADCYDATAQGHGFKSWMDFKNSKSLPYFVPFEKAVDGFLCGDFELVKALITKCPAIISMKSPYAHRATLLHYAASNGVELWRQVVPSNIVEMTTYLLEKGANLEAKMNVYGGEFDPLSLLVSSAHPYAAGVVEPMKRLLGS